MCPCSVTPEGVDHFKTRVRGGVCVEGIQLAYDWVNLQTIVNTIMHQ